MNLSSQIVDESLLQSVAIGAGGNHPLLSSDQPVARHSETQPDVHGRQRNQRTRLPAQGL